MVETWDFLQSPAGSAALNMAIDEALLRTAVQRERSLLRVYSWEKPSVSFGYFQKFPGHLAGPPHLDPLPASGERKFPSPFLKGEGQGEGFDQIVRRPTGGGVVYHGEDTTYTVVVPPTHSLFTMPTTDAYCALHKVVAAALEFGADVVGRVPSRGAVVTSDSPAEGSGPTPMIASRNYECFQNPVHGDVVADGRKLAGGAQRHTKSGMLHQGSIAAKLSADHLKRGFEETLGVEFVEYELTETDRTLAEKLACEKYATDAWNRHLR